MQNLAENNLHLVHIIARIQKRKFPYLDLDELIAAGNLGLVKAARDYNQALGSFSNFASPRIAGEMMDMERELRWGKITKRQKTEPVEDCELLESKNSRFYQTITDVLDKECKNIFVWYYRDNYSLEDIAEKMGTGISWISQLLKKSRNKIKETFEPYELFEEIV